MRALQEVDVHTKKETEDGQRLCTYIVQHVEVTHKYCQLTAGVDILAMELKEG